MYYPRAMRQSVLDASEQFPVVLLTGPRQVGKTTLLQHLCEKGRKYATLDDPALRTLAREDPGLFLQRFEPPVLIDEIQYAPQLLPLIKMVRGYRSPDRHVLAHGLPAVSDDEGHHRDAGRPGGHPEPAGLLKPRAPPVAAGRFPFSADA